jgi:hypothetical protein
MPACPSIPFSWTIPTAHVTAGTSCIAQSNFVRSATLFPGSGDEVMAWVVQRALEGLYRLEVEPNCNRFTVPRGTGTGWDAVNADGKRATDGSIQDKLLEY